jgi:hypothetical protein
MIECRIVCVQMFVSAKLAMVATYNHPKVIDGHTDAHIRESLV